MKIISANLTNNLAPTDGKATGNPRIETLPWKPPSTTACKSPAAAGSQVATSSDVDMDKVAALRQAIDSGTYQVSADSIFDGLAASVRETLP